MGAGRAPTTSAIIGDVVEAVRKMGSNSPLLEPHNGTELTVRPIGDLLSRYYVRLEVADHPGVLAQIAQILGDGRISIAAVLQRDTHPETDSAEIVITTHPAREESMQNALKAMTDLPQVKRVSNTLRIEE
jgi:homoserine dehydrogenase